MSDPPAGGGPLKWGGWETFGAADGRRVRRDEAIWEEKDELDLRPDPPCEDGFCWRDMLEPESKGEGNQGFVRDGRRRRQLGAARAERKNGRPSMKSSARQRRAIYQGFEGPVTAAIGELCDAEALSSPSN